MDGAVLMVFCILFVSAFLSNWQQMTNWSIQTERTKVCDQLLLQPLTYWSQPVFISKLLFFFTILLCIWAEIHITVYIKKKLNSWIEQSWIWFNSFKECLYMMCSELMMCFLSLSLSEETGSVLWEHCESDQTKARLLRCRLLWAGLPLISPGENFSYNPESFHISPSPWRCQFLCVNALHCEFVWYISKSMEINYWCLCVASPNPSTETIYTGIKYRHFFPEVNLFKTNTCIFLCDVQRLICTSKAYRLILFYMCTRPRLKDLKISNVNINV